MRSGPWAPLDVPIFRAIWMASLASNVGTWMQNVAAAWLMALLTPSPLLVALVQTAQSLPVFLLGLPAGALADIVDRRRVLVVTQTWMLVAAAALGVLTMAGLANAWVVLALTFVLGLGSAVNGPAWQATVPELVGRPMLPAAVALNSAGFNAARAVGPALAGVVVAAVGAGAAFLLNAVSFAGVVVVLARWKKPIERSVLPGERILSATRAALRYVRFEPALQTVLWRSGTFVFSASALWALLPVVARDRLSTGAIGYGILLGAMGAGAVIGAVLLPRFRAGAPADRIVSVSTLAFAAATLGVAWTPGVASSAMVLAVAGASWSAGMSSFNLATQQAVPDWIRARAMAAYLLVFQSSMAAGSFAFGLVAEHFGLRMALVSGAAGIGLASAVWGRRSLAHGERRDLTPSRHWHLPAASDRIDELHGPVLVTVEYEISPPDVAAFLAAMEHVGRTRRRDGASAWGLFQDADAESRFVETFVVETWGEHMRQHERATMYDRDLEQQAYRFHAATTPPVVRHLVLASPHRHEPPDRLPE